LQSWFGIAPQRSLPSLAAESFSAWFAQQKQLPKQKKVVLFSDTYTEFNEPEIGKAAFKILSALDYEMILAKGFCCGRPYISKGFLKEAKQLALNWVAALKDIVNEETRLIVLEPSCLSAMRDDYQGLLGKDPAWEKLRSNTFSLEEFLRLHLKEGKLPLTFSVAQHEVWLHGHCHQKALSGTAPTLEVLRGVPGFSVHEIDSGCCGMAGSFGYEKEHYHFSMKIGELKLFPKLREIPEQDMIVASGMSCRSQIKDGTRRRALHLAEVIANML
jgi:Fe-S oxidoreductase